MSDLIETLASYVPALVTRRLAADPDPIKSPAGACVAAAVLYADISGFTPLTERLAGRGPAGTEELTRLLNAYFGQLIDLVQVHGGDIVKFAGDALLSLWAVGTTDEDLATVTYRAAQCGLLIQAVLHDHAVGEGIRLSMRIGIGAGEVMIRHVGGVYGRWEVIVSGAPLTQIGAASHLAAPGQVVVSPEGWDLIGDRCVGTPLAAPGDHGQPGGVRLNDVTAPLPFYAQSPPRLGPETETALRAYIPGAILARLAAGQGGWLAELRRVSVLFINLPDLNYAMPLEQAQAMMQTLQTALYHYEGSINKLSLDDKGVSLVAALGLPPLAHEDDPARAVQAALAMQQELQRLGLTSAIGISTGRAFCGSVGSPARREYTMLGDVVNLAARLMQAAPGDILCDAATYQQASQAHLAFEPLPPLRVKGKAEPVAAYRPRAGTPGFQARVSHSRRPHLNVELVGRRAERAILAEKLQSLFRQDAGSVVIIEGEAGIGKSRLVEDVLEKAAALDMTVLVGAGDAIEKSTPYHAWRPVFRQLFGLDGFSGDAGRRRSHVLARLEAMLRAPGPAVQLNAHDKAVRLSAHPVPGGLPSVAVGEVGRYDEALAGDGADPAAWLRLAPLLNAVLPLDLDENELTGQMTGQVRADNTQELLLQLLNRLTYRGEDQPERPCVLILEDAHWLDSASWALAGLVCQRIQPVQPVLLLVATRPLPPPIPAEYSLLVQAPATRHVVLDMLPAEEALVLVCQRLGVHRLPEPLAALIQEKAEGHPFFSEELAYALRDAGLVQVTNGECRLAVDPAGLDAALNFPDTVQGVITSRIDRLSPPHQLTLKVASVMGRIFAFRALHDVYPLEADKNHLRDYMDTLARLDITPLESAEPELAYIFKHIITQEVAYNMMLFAQRQKLHRAAAEWYEQHYADDLDPYYPLLAHHWRRAGVADKAMTYLEKAGEQALNNYANQEAVRFFSRALQLAEQPEESLEPAQPPPAVAPERRAVWELRLGEAYLNWRKLTEGRRHLEAGLAGLPCPLCIRRGSLGVPGSPAATIQGLGIEVLRQLRQRLRPAVRLSEARPTAERAWLLEAAHAYEGLAEVYYFANETALSLYAAIRCLNLAEAAGLSPELARAYALVGAIMGFVPLPSAAELYCRKALEAARRVDHLPARAFVALATGTYYTGIGRWDQARALLDEVVAISERLGDRRRWEDGISNLAVLRYFQGDFAESARLSQEYYESARRRDDLHNQAWALRGLVYCLLATGRSDEALPQLERLADLLTRDTSLVDEALRIDTWSLLALAYQRQGRPEPALALAGQALELAGRTSPTSYPSLPGYAGLAEVYLTLWEQRGGRELKDRARRACQALRAYARVFPVGLPQAYRWQGVYEWLSGRPYLAREQWAKSLAEAGRLAMPYPQGLTCDEIGRRLPPGHPARAGYLALAEQILEQLGARKE